MSLRQPNKSFGTFQLPLLQNCDILELHASIVIKSVYFASCADDTRPSLYAHLHVTLNDLLPLFIDVAPLTINLSSCGSSRVWKFSGFSDLAAAPHKISRLGSQYL